MQLTFEVFFGTEGDSQTHAESTENAIQGSVHLGASLTFRLEASGHMGTWRVRGLEKDCFTVIIS